MAKAYLVWCGSRRGEKSSGGGISAEKNVDGPRSRASGQLKLNRRLRGEKTGNKRTGGRGLSAENRIGVARYGGKTGNELTPGLNLTSSSWIEGDVARGRTGGI